MTRTAIAIAILALLTGIGCGPPDEESSADATGDAAPSRESDAGTSDDGGGAPPIETDEVLTSGTNHACSLEDDGSIVCWGIGTDPNTDEIQSQAAKTFGHSDHDQAVPPTGQFKHVAAAADSSCAVKSDGSLTCWGELDSAPGGHNYARVDVTGSAICALRDDQSMVCWKNESGFPQFVDSQKTYTEFSILQDFMCGVTASHELNCWDLNPDEPSGYDEHKIPSGKFEHVAVSEKASCGARPDGTVVCWGEGIGTPCGQQNCDETREPLSKTYDFEVFEAGAKQHFCGITTSGEAVCFTHGQKLQSDYVKRPHDADPVDVSLGWFHACWRYADGRLTCDSSETWEMGIGLDRDMTPPDSIDGD